MKPKFLVSIAALGMAIVATAAAAGGYRVAKTIVLGGEGSWDYLTLDKGGGRLFIARATHVMVVDPESGKNLGEIPDTAGVHGIALAPSLGRGFTSNGKESTVTVFDLKSLQVLKKIKTGNGPDAIIFDPASRYVFTFNARGQDATALDPINGKVAASIALGSKPEFAVTDDNGRVFVNIEDKSELVAIDSNKLAVANRWKLTPCEEPSGLAMDKEHRRLFAGCANKLMAVVNADSGKIITTLPIGEHVDANAFDPGTGLAFSSNGDGTLTVVHEDSPDKYSVVANVDTARGARTMALDPETHKIYLVTAKFGPPAPAMADNPHPRPTIIADTFELIVVAPE